LTHGETYHKMSPTNPLLSKKKQLCACAKLKGHTFEHQSEKINPALFRATN